MKVTPSPAGAFEDGSIGRRANDTIAVLEQVARGPQLIVESWLVGWLADVAGGHRMSETDDLARLCTTIEELLTRSD